MEKPPAGYETDLSEYGPCIYDNNEVIAWGFKILRHLGEERFQNLNNYGCLECLDWGEWILVTKKLTPEDAIKKYGPITKQERGPNGGYQGTYYGKTLLSHKWLKPSPELQAEFDAKQPKSNKQQLACWIVRWEHFNHNNDQPPKVIERTATFYLTEQIANDAIKAQAKKEKKDNIARSKQTVWERGIFNHDQIYSIPKKPKKIIITNKYWILEVETQGQLVISKNSPHGRISHIQDYLLNVITGFKQNEWITK
jgi:hypothetical protein